MGVNSLPKTVTRQRRDCDLNPGRSAPESSTLTTRLPSHPTVVNIGVNAAAVAGFATHPQYLTCRGRPVLTTPNILTSVLLFPFSGTSEYRKWPRTHHITPFWDEKFINFQGSGTAPPQTTPPRRLRRLDSRVFGAWPATPPQCSSGVDAHGHWVSFSALTTVAVSLMWQKCIQPAKAVPLAPEKILF